MDKDQEAHIDRVRAAFNRAQQEADQLPLSVPGPIRDQFFTFLMNDLLEGPHRTDHCEGCRTYALNMALSALGWSDLNAPRPATAKERMDALFAQVTAALQFLDKLHKGVDLAL